jgi:hypothetical protein
MRIFYSRSLASDHPIAGSKEKLLGKLKSKTDLSSVIFHLKLETRSIRFFTVSENRIYGHKKHLSPFHP